MAKPVGEGALLPFLDLDRQRQAPLYSQLTQQLRSAILAGQLKPGQRLPATRLLMAEKGVSRSTIVTAFEQLIAEGYLDGRTGSGTYVKSTLIRSEVKNRNVGHSFGPVDPEKSADGYLALSKRGRQTVGALPRDDVGPRRAGPFTPNTPAFDLLPMRVWNKLTNRVQRRPGSHLLTYGDPAGYPPLRRAVARYLSESRGVRCEPEQVVVTSGSQKALNLIAALLLDPGDKIIVEDPSSVLGNQVFRAYGATLRPAQVDADGPRIGDPVWSEDQVKMTYLTPSCQYPLGSTLSASGRLALLEWASRTGAWIVEDDDDSEFRFVGQPIPAMQGMSDSNRVIYIWSFSEVLFSSLRLGVLVVPEQLVDSFSVVNGLHDRGPPTLPQAVLCEFINDGYFTSHIRAMRGAYSARREALLDALNRRLGGLVSVEPTPSGLRLVAQLPQWLDDRQAERAALEHGIFSFALSQYSIERSDLNGLLLGFASTPPGEMDQGVQRLARALESIGDTTKARHAG